MPVQQSCIVSEQEIHEATDKVILSQPFLDSILREYSNRELPYPITFALSHGTQKTHVGVREFSAADGQITLPTTIAQNLAIKAGLPVNVRLVELPKGESVKLRPLVAGYDLNQDWKVALEGAFRSHYTTLTKGNIIALKSGMRFLIDELEPADAVCIVDTDLEVVLEPLSEEQALETVKATEEFKNVTASVVDLTVDQPVQSISDGTQSFRFLKWDKTMPIRISLEGSHPDMCLLVSSDDTPPSLQSNLWSDYSSHCSKEIIIGPDNLLIHDMSALRIAVASDSMGPFSISISQSLKRKSSATSTTISNEETQCSNCGTVVPRQSLILHERHCMRNNKPCSAPNCSFIFKKGLNSHHWHCSACGTGGEGSLALHMERHHASQSCECGHQYSDLPSIAFHRATSCAERQRICQFCHLLVPQGDPRHLSYADSAIGYTAHEAECGSRTTTCETCHRLIKLKDFTTHTKYHDADRIHHLVPQLCINQNCVRLRGRQNNALDLCAECFGPLYSTEQDETGEKLRGRVKRRYATQLMSGCKREWCRNVYCATATNSKLTYTAALNRVAEMHSDAKHSFCVDQATQEHRVQAEVLECEGEYAIEWCCRAMDVAHGDVSHARSWLKREAVKKSEM